jgi:hypothetical protein
MFWAPPKTCALAAFVGAAYLAAHAKGTYIESCLQQRKCLKWEVQKLSGAATSNCDIPPNECPVKICLVYDEDATDACYLGRYDKVDQICDNANSSGCVRALEWVGSGGGKDSGSGSCNPGYAGTTAWDKVCTSVATNTKFCQIGKSGQTLYWNVYVRRSVMLVILVIPQFPPAAFVCLYDCQPVLLTFSTIWQRGRGRQRDRRHCVRLLQPDGGCHEWMRSIGEHCSQHDVPKRSHCQKVLLRK